MFPARRFLSMQTQNICVFVRIADTPSSGVVVTPDCFVEIADGSSLYSPQGLSLRVYPSSILSMVKIVILFF
jgi:hypothetical protein